MKHAILFTVQLLLAGALFGQQFVVTDRHEEFIVSDRVVDMPPPEPVIRETVNVQVPQMMPPNRYIIWPGWGTIDLETYSKNCTCGMCNSIRSMQVDYRRQLAAYQQAMLNPPKTVSPMEASQAPTPPAVIEQTVRLLALTKDDVLADLGCGDGRILIAAVERYGCKAVGVEIDPVIADEARRRVKASGLSAAISILTGDALAFDPKAYGVTAITAYLYPELLAQLTTVFKTPGVRIVASPYHQIPGLSMKQHGEVWVSSLSSSPARSRRYLALFTANYCGPCRAWKNLNKKKLEAKGFTVQEYEMTDPEIHAKYGKRITSVPTLVIHDETGAWIGEPIVGGDTAENLLPLLQGTGN
jgi:SAM-dependent methyltransferase